MSKLQPKVNEGEYVLQYDTPPFLTGNVFTVKDGIIEPNLSAKRNSRLKTKEYTKRQHELMHIMYSKIPLDIMIKATSVSGGFNEWFKPLVLKK